jgi:hypothetical protein
MNKWYFWLMLFVLQLQSAGLSYGQVTDYDTIYTSRDLSGHLVNAECNPGGETSCPCSSADVSISSFGTYGTVTSNVSGANTYVNAIGYKKFEETFPNGDSIALGVYKYVGYIRLPIIPHEDLTQEQNAQAVHFMIQVWDGRGSLLNSNDSSYEGTIYWEINPWIQPTGEIKIYIDSTNSSGYTLTETGLMLSPDTLWHRFEIIIDLTTRKYVSLSIDTSTKSLNYQLHRVYHPDWGNDISLNITTESLAAWPQSNCSYIFTWTTCFKDLAFYEESTTTEVSNKTWIPWSNTLSQNFPNPFNPSTSIQYGLPARSSVRLVIYNVLGQAVKELINTEQQVGIQSVTWNANVSSGLYFYRLEAASIDNPGKRFVETKKMLLLR